MASAAIALLAVLLPAVWGLRLPSDGLHSEPPGPVFPRPEYTEYAKMARWLVHSADWGVVATTSRHLGGAPFGNVASFADGPHGSPTGRLLFYLSPMDATAYDLQRSDNASLTICEAQLLPHGCGSRDAEEPTCAKLTASGSLRQVPEAERAEAEALLFPRHPAMRRWPAGHKFSLYELHITTLRLLDYYGGPHDLSPDDYFSADLS